MARLRHRPSVRGSALISSLLVIVVLSVIVTAFLQSMTIERQTARSYLNRYRATLAAEAAANQCQNLMATLFETYPDSCTAWTTFPNTRGTTFYYRTLAGGEMAALPKDTETGKINLRALPLISGASSQLVSNLSESKVFPNGLTTGNSIDLNRKDWIGSPVNQTTPQIIRASWIDILEDQNAARDNTFDPAKGRPKNGVVARYAFWIEDDSFRVNVNTSGMIPRDSTTLGSGASEIDLKGLTEAVTADDIAAKIVSIRDTLPDKKFLSSSQINYAAGDDQYKKLKYYVTDTSKALNFSRGGVKRLDLNQVVTDTSTDTKIHDQLGRIIAAVGNDYAIPDRVTPHKSWSDFGQRFFHTGSFPGALNRSSATATSTFNYPDIYMQKIAANIRDYIDTDSQPTIVQNDPDYPVRKAAKPDATSPIGFDPAGNAGSPSDTVAVGKEAVPALQEYALRVKLISMSPPKYSSPGATSATYEMEESQYFEFFNPTTKAIKVSDLGTSPFLLISNQVAYDTSGGTIIPHGRVTEIPLKNFVDKNNKPLSEFPPGRATVLTTDPSPEPTLASGGDTSLFFHPDAATITAIDGNRHFKGTTKNHATSSPMMFRLLPKLGTADGRAGSSSTDYDTHVMIGNEKGVLESFTALAIPEALSVKYDDNATSPPPASTQFFRGGSLKGNVGGSAAVASGDARSLNEQLSIRRYVSGVTDDITRFLNISLSSGPTSTQASFGAFANPSFVDPTLWPDYAPTAAKIKDASTAFARIANDKLASIGQLGDIYDPMREAGSSGIDYARGGGRTLRIGQSERYTSNAAGPDGQWDGAQDSISRNRAAWRLADIFSTNDDLTNAGVININGVTRDQGAALRAALYNLKFGNRVTDDAALKGKDLDINSLVTAIQQRFPSSTSSEGTKEEPFWERGEISEIRFGSDAIFNAGSKLAGVNMKTVLDRGREELVRRVMDLVTTKGNVYRAYCVGQAITTNQQGQMRILSHQTLKVTFELVPVFNSPLPSDDTFDPVAELASSGSSSTKRFRQPDSYSVNVLSVDTQ